MTCATGASEGQRTRPQASGWHDDARDWGLARDDAQARWPTGPRVRGAWPWQERMSTCLGNACKQEGALAVWPWLATALGRSWCQLAASTGATCAWSGVYASLPSGGGGRLLRATQRATVTEVRNEIVQQASR
jgi:hypothetical protein